MRAPPWRVRRLVDDVTQIVEAARIGGFARCQPRLARLPALPGARREAENLDLDTAALQRPRQNVGARRRYCDRASAHRAGIVEQQRHHRVAEGRFLLVHERQRMERIGDHARQPRRIENAFLEIEIPGAVLLRHQLALQAIGEPRHDVLQMRELLVEIAAQALQFVVLAEIFRRHDLVEFRRKGMIFRPARLVAAAAGRAMGLARRFVLAHLVVVKRIAGGRLRALHGVFRHLLGGGLRLVGAHLLRRLGVG